MAASTRESDSAPPQRRRPSGAVGTSSPSRHRRARSRLASSPIEQRQREPIGELLLDHPPQRPCAVGRVIAHVAEQLLGLVGERDLARRARRHARSRARPAARRSRRSARASAPEADDVVEPVDELGLEVLGSSSLAQARVGLDRVVRSVAVSPRRPTGMFEVMIRTVFLKSTVRPCPSVRRPSSITCSSVLNTSGCAFSISSSNTTAYGRRRTASVS